MSFNAEIWDKTLLAESVSKNKSKGSHKDLSHTTSQKPISEASSEASSDEEITHSVKQKSEKFSFGSLKRRGPSPSSLGEGKSKPGSNGVWYKIFHHGEEDLPSDSNLSSSPGSPSLKPKNFLWGKSKRTVDSDDEYHSDDSHASSSSVFSMNSMKLPPSALHSESKSSQTHSDKKPPSKSSLPPPLLSKKSESKRSGTSLFHPKAEDSSDNESSHEVPARRPSTNIFKDLFWRSSASSQEHPVTASLPDVSHGENDPPMKPLKQGSPHFGPISSQESMPTLSRNLSETSLSDKYGRKENVLGRGATATVRLCCPMNSKKRFAIKEFRKRRKDESQKEYIKKLIAEFCISSSLDHPNVVKTIDLIQDESHSWCVVMEYCEGGDLFTRIVSGLLTNPEEYNCYFKQLILGVQYLHSMGVAHRDLKPENLLLDKECKILKITDFGVSEVFRDPFHSGSKKAHGLCGSGPYIAPEEFNQAEYDSESVDIWAIGIIYFTMANTSCPWKSAVPTDARYHKYIESKSCYYPIERLSPGQRQILYRILDPNPLSRITLKGLLEDDFVKNIHVCYEKGFETSHSHQS